MLQIVPCVREYHGVLLGEDQIVAYLQSNFEHHVAKTALFNSDLGTAEIASWEPSVKWICLYFNIGVFVSLIDGYLSRVVSWCLLGIAAEMPSYLVYEVDYFLSFRGYITLCSAFTRCVQQENCNNYGAWQILFVTT